MDISDARIRSYFERAAADDLEAYYAQFASTAVVEDEGREYRGIDAIRGWRTSVPTVRYDILEVTRDPDGTVGARTEISGDFPGSPVILAFRFGFDPDGRIVALTIRG